MSHYLDNFKCFAKTKTCIKTTAFLFLVLIIMSGQLQQTSGSQEASSTSEEDRNFPCLVNPFQTTSCIWMACNTGKSEMHISLKQFSALQTRKIILKSILWLKGSWWRNLRTVMMCSTFFVVGRTLVAAAFCTCCDCVINFEFEKKKSYFLQTYLMETRTQYRIKLGDNKNTKPRNK